MNALKKFTMHIFTQLSVVKRKFPKIVRIVGIRYMYTLYRIIWQISCTCLQTSLNFKLRNSALYSRQVHDSTAVTMHVSGASTQQLHHDQVSPNVVRKLFENLVDSNFKTVYKGPSWTKNDGKSQKDCFCKHGTVDGTRGRIFDSLSCILYTFFVFYLQR